MYGPLDVLLGRAKGSAPGTFYIEVLRISSAERLIDIKGRFDGISANGVFAESSWLENKYFVAPLSGETKIRSFLICDMQSG